MRYNATLNVYKVHILEGPKLEFDVVVVARSKKEVRAHNSGVQSVEFLFRTIGVSVIGGGGVIVRAPGKRKRQHGNH